jgi:hypothetical protein
VLQDRALNLPTFTTHSHTRIHTRTYTHTREREREREKFIDNQIDDYIHFSEKTVLDTRFRVQFETFQYNMILWYITVGNSYQSHADGASLRTARTLYC